MKLRLVFCTILVFSWACNDNQILDLTNPPPGAPPDVPVDYQPRLYIVWDASDAMLQSVAGLDLDGDGNGTAYDRDDDMRWVFTCGDSNDVVHPHYGTSWVSWSSQSNTRYDLMAAGLLEFLDQGAADPAANGNLISGTPLDPAVTPNCPALSENGKDDNHDSLQIDLALLAMGTSYGGDYAPGTADDDACRFKDETTALRKGGGPVRSFFKEVAGDGGFPADTTAIDGITHNDWVADQVLYSDPGGNAQVGLALQALAAPADGALDADGIASIADVMARDANSGCRPYAVVVVSASAHAPGCGLLDDDAENAATSLWAAGVPTYVVAPDDSGAGARSFLGDIAAAGGTSPQFVGTVDQVRDAFQSIANELGVAAAGCP